MKDNLQLAHRRRGTIKTLVAYIRAMRAWIKENDTLQQEERKELTRVISKRNKRILTLEQQVDNNKELIHLREVVKNQGIKNMELNKKINQYELEKLNA